QVGLPYMTGPNVFRRPVNHLLPAWDLISGQMVCVGLLAAERHRRRTGRGQLVKLALKDVATAAVAHLGMIAEVMVNNIDRPRDGNYLYGAFGRDFTTLDGRQVMIVGLTTGQWRSLVKLTGLGPQIDDLEARLQLDFSQEGDRFRARRQLARLFEPWFETRMYAEVKKLFNEGGVTWAPYHTIREMIERDVDCSEENHMFEMVDQPGIGRYLMPGSPLQFGDIERLPVRRAPKLGEDTDQILLDVLGLPEAEVGRLHDAGIVAGPAD
ncbi:MAG: CoA transferase, partial [Pseudomonadota bacterium]